jgi:hypothetical protein
VGGNFTRFLQRREGEWEAGSHIEDEEGEWEGGGAGSVWLRIS